MIDKKNTFFSIIVPLYNKERYVKSTIESVLNQSCKDFELIIVDDGSTDNSLQIVQEFTDNRIKLFAQKNSGVAAARNKGISEANSRWVVFIDADDLWSPLHLETLFEIAKKYPEAGMIATTHKKISSSEGISCLEDSNCCEIKLINYFLEAQSNIGIVHTSCVAIKKIVFAETHGFKNYKRGEDLELWARVALKYPVAISNKVTSFYRQETGGVMNTGYWSNNPPAHIDDIKLEDFSPSAAFLCDNLDSYKSIDVINYINKRVLTHMRANCIRVDAKAAKKMSLYLVKPVIINSLNDFFYFFILKFPVFIVNSVFCLRRKLKKILGR